jgi:hypothetical protein
MALIPGWLHRDRRSNVKRIRRVKTIVQKLFCLIATILLSAAAISAQTSRDSKPGSERSQSEYAAHLKDPKLAEREGNSDKRKARLKEDANLRAPGVLRLGPSRTYLRDGLSTDDVVRLLGTPASVSEKQEGNARLTTYMFPRGDGRVIIAEFANGALIRSRTEICQELTTTAAQDKEDR